MTNNGGAVMNLLGDLAAVLGHNISTLLNVGGVHNNIIFLMTLLSLLLDWLLVALLLNILVALWSRRVTSMASLSIRDWTTGDEANTDKSNTQFVHV